MRENFFEEKLFFECLLCGKKNIFHSFFSKNFWKKSFFEKLFIKFYIQLGNSILSGICSICTQIFFSIFLAKNLKGSFLTQRYYSGIQQNFCPGLLHTLGNHPWFRELSDNKRTRDEKKTARHATCLSRNKIWRPL